MIDRYEFKMDICWSIYKLNVVLLQETMCDGKGVVEFLSTRLKDWSFCTLDAKVLFGGLVIGWSFDIDTLSTSILSIGLQVECRSKEMGKVFDIINLYGPDEEMNIFQDILSDQGKLKGYNVIIRGV